ncbi:MAG: helix-turn-helix domain-containing protein, partial [Anaerolineales bacterium]|nr:helix-turn-helix domain-containing protein [Anaerolineales bacterium]
MVWFILAHIFRILVAVISVSRLSDLEKDLEILLLRHQLAILQRKTNKPVKPNQIEKLTLAILTAKLQQVTQRPSNQLHNFIRIFQPETVLRWHRELVRRKWSFIHKSQGGRPRIHQELEELIIRLAQENPRWGYGKIQGEILKLDSKVSQTTIRNIFERNNIQPALVRSGSIGWRTLINHYKDQIQACDFFTGETIQLQTLYVFFFIELGSRQVYFASITANPNETWVTQQARQLVWDLSDRDKPLRFFIHGNDGCFCQAFDAVSESEGLHVINTPVRAPNAN